MSIRLSLPKTTELKPRIVVFGVGGAGGNAVNNMIDADLMGCDFVVANTDAQALARSKAERRVQMGLSTTQGLGAGADPDVGMRSAEESEGEIVEHLDGANMVFITAGMGGGTGTGAAPVIARAAKEQGILTVAVVTKPFNFEGSRRMKMADAGLAELQKYVDTLIVIPNQNLFRVANERTTMSQAFQLADEVLQSGVRSITDLMVMPGLINLDFADVRTVMSEMGKAMMGTGEASGEKRALEAATAAINNPLLDDVSLKGARGVLINITGGYDMTLYEVDEAANHIREEVDENANIIVGSAFDEAMEGKIRVSVVATGIDAEMMAQQPRPAASIAQPAVAVPSARIPLKPAPSGPTFAEKFAAERAAAAARAAEQRAAATAQEAAERAAHEAAAARQAEQDRQAAQHAEAQRLEIQRLEAERALAEARAREPVVHQPAQRPVEPVANPVHQQRERIGGAFSGLFGRARRPEPMQDAPAAPARPAAQQAPLFSDEFDESTLEIPTFLRRQAN